MGSGWQELVVPHFGGGLNLSAHPAYIEPHEWSWSNGFLARDGYAECLTAFTAVTLTAFPPADFEVIGVCPNAFSTVYPIVVGLGNMTTGAIRLYAMKVDGTFVETTWDAVGTQPRCRIPTLNDQPCMRTAYLDGYQVFVFGAGTTSDRSLIRTTFNSGAGFGGTYSSNGDPIEAEYISSVAGRLFAAGITTFDVPGFHTTAWADAGVGVGTSVWTPATDASNAAGRLILDDPAIIVGLAPLTAANAMGVFTRSGLYAFASTGQAIPSFTRQLYSRQGCRDGSMYMTPRGDNPVVVMPYGTFFRGWDDFYMAGSASGLGRKIYPYVLQREQDSTVFFSPPNFEWHADLGAVIVPLPYDDGPEVYEFLFFEPTTGAWSRRTMTSIQEEWARHTIITDGLAQKQRTRHVVMTNDGHQLNVEALSGDGQSGAIVYTKDFCFEDPQVTDYVNRIKIDWEGLNSAATDSIAVYASVRNDLRKGFQGSMGLDTTEDLTFTLVGTLTGGATELDLRLKGKYVRFGFARSVGRPRIRGFSIRRRQGGGRKT